MARIITNVSVFIAAAALVVTASGKPSVANVHSGMMFFDGGCNGCGSCPYDETTDHASRDCGYDHGNDYNCGGCPKSMPQVTVHVIQPPPTYIYDVTQTACYTEHRDRCGCPYVCGPTCIPQGEVLAPNSIGEHVVITDNSHRDKGCCHHHRKHKE